MGCDSRFVFLALFSFALATALFSNASAAQGGRNGPIPGGWVPISDPKDPKVVEIANFAVNTHNQEAKTNLKFEKVIKGETQLVSGINYKLVIAAKDGSAEHEYEAVVYDNPWNKVRQLTSFKQL